MLTYEVYARSSGPGFAYRIFLEDGSVQTVQRIAPGAQGLTPMTEAEADAFARADIAAQTVVPPEPEPEQA
jgi:hypothetical protein